MKTILEESGIYMRFVIKYLTLFITNSDSLSLSIMYYNTFAKLYANYRFLPLDELDLLG